MSLVPELQVSPNPTSRVVRVQLGLGSPNEEVRLGILGSHGQWVQQETLQVKGNFLDKQMDISTLPAGTYFVQVMTNRNVYNKRIIVVR
jgi:hypothetical protein